MISTTAPLPLPAPAYEDFAPSGNPDTAHDDSNSMSFSSRLDQQINQRSPQRTRSADTRPLASARDEAASTSDTDSAPASSASPADAFLRRNDAPAAAGQGDPSQQPLETQNTLRERAARDSEDKDKTEDKGHTDALTDNASASLPPLTPAALAIVQGIVPVPAAPVPVTANAGGQTSKATVNTILADARSQTGANAASPLPADSAVPINPSDKGGATLGQPAATAASASTLPPVQASAAAPAALNPALPLTSSDVPMDSRANGQTTAPGVANALPQPAAANSADANTPAQQQPAAGLLPNGSANGLPTRAVTLDAAAANPQTAGAASALTTHKAEVSPAPLNGSVAQTTAPVQIPVTIPQVAQADAAVTAQANPLPVLTYQNASVIAPSGAVSEKQADTPGKEQRLDGINRLLTLNTGKAASVESSAADARTETSASSGGKTAATSTPAPYNTQASGIGGVPAPAAMPVKSVSIANAVGVPSAGQPTGAVNTGTDISAGINANTGSGMTGMVSSRPGSLPQVLASGQALVSSPSSALTGDASGVTAGNGALEAAFPVVGASSSDAAAGGQEQSGAQNRSQADNAPANGEIGQDGGAAANASITARETGGTTAAASSASPNSSSQIDRAHVVAQVTRHLEGMRLSGGSGEMSLRLAPQHLGSVQITVAAHQDGVIARIAVESVQVQQAMEGAKEHLRGTLEARGLHVRNVEVTVTPHLTGQDSAAYNGQRNRQANAERADMPASYARRAASPVTPAGSVETTALPAPAPFLTDSRLDYSA